MLERRHSRHRRGTVAQGISIAKVLAGGSDAPGRCRNVAGGRRAYGEALASFRRALGEDQQPVFHFKPVSCSAPSTARRQNIWLISRRRLAGCRPRLGFDVGRRGRGVASADVQWSVA